MKSCNRGHCLITLLLGAALALSLAACRQSDATVAGGGIGGTGKGTITAINVVGTSPADEDESLPLTTSIGSVTLNGTQQFTLTSGTQFLIDGAPVSAARLAAVAQGLVASVDVGDDVSPDFSSGTAVNVAGEYAVIGPVTSLNPLTVLGQIVQTTNNTVGASLVGSLTLGEVVGVSGNTDSGGAIQATRLDIPPAGTDWWLTGIVTGTAADSFDVGPQQVLLNGVTPDGCGSSLASGDFVKVAATADPSYSGVLTTTTAVTCTGEGLEVPPGLASGSFPVQLEGFVTALNPNGTDFTLSGQVVHTTPQTAYTDGQLADLQVGARVRVIGQLDLAAGIVTAHLVNYSELRVQIVAPLTAANVTPTSITALGITLRVTALTRDPQNLLSLLANGSLNAQVEVDGFWDGVSVFATMLKTTGSAMPDATNVTLQGPVTAVNADQVHFTILGTVTVDTTSMQLGPGNIGGSDPAAFVGSLAGELVTVTHGSYAAGTLSDNGSTNPSTRTTVTVQPGAAP